MKIVIPRIEINGLIDKHFEGKIEERLNKFSKEDMERVFREAFIGYLKMFNIRDVIKVYETGNDIKVMKSKLTIIKRQHDFYKKFYESHQTCLKLPFQKKME